MKERSVGDDLDVVDLYIEAENDDVAVESRPHRPRSTRPWVIAAVIAVVVAVVLASVALDNPESDPAESATPATTRSPPTTAPLPSLPEIAGDPLVQTLDTRVAFSRTRDVVVLSPALGTVERVDIDVSPAGATVIGATMHSLLVTADDAHFLVTPTGDVGVLKRVRVIPSADGLGWWSVGADRLQPIGFDAQRIGLPDDTIAVAALADGFLLQRADAETGELLTWQPGTEPASLTPGIDAVVAAVHPHRIAWYEARDAGQLHVTEPATGKTLTLLGAMPLFDAGEVSGRFSPDGTYLAIRVVPSTEPADLVVYDLRTGEAVVRESLGAGQLQRSGPQYEQPLAFDFTADSTRIILSRSNRRRLMAVDLATGASTAASSEFNTVTSIVTLDAPRGAPPDALAERTSLGVKPVIATLRGDGTSADIVDLGTGTVRRVEMSGNSRVGLRASWPAAIVAVADGFVATTGRASYWIPLDGAAVQHDAADYVLASTDRERAWLFRQRDDYGGWDVVSIDGHTGELRPERTVRTTPVGIIGETFVGLTQPSFDEPGHIELWNIRTGVRREIDLDGTPNGAVVTSGHLLTASEGCATVPSCPLLAIDLETGATTEIGSDIEPYAMAGTSVGDVAYWYSRNGGLVRVDAAAGTAESVPNVTRVMQWWAASDGSVVYSTQSGAFVWTPGTDPVRLSPTGLETDYSTGVAVR